MDGGGGGAAPDGSPHLVLLPKLLRGRFCREGEIFHRGGQFKKKIKNYIPQKGKEKKPGAAGKGPDLAAKIVLKLKKKIRQGSRSGRAAGEGGERRDFKQRKRSMRKGPEFFPGWIPARRATNPGATALGAAGKSGRAKRTRKRRRSRRTGGGGRTAGGAGLPPPADRPGIRGGGAEPRGAPGRGRAREPAGLGASVLALLPPEASFPISRFNNPKSGRNFSGVAGFFSCLVLFWKRKRLNPLQEPVSKSLFLKAIDCKSLI